jgi:uncharacterized membrane protein
MTLDTLLLAVFLPALILATGWLMPSLVPPSVPFAVRIPPERVGEAVIVRQRNAYRWWVTLAGGAVLAASVTLSILGELALVRWAAAAVLLLVLLPGYLHARHTIRAVKLREGWYEGLRQAVVADTSLRTQPEHFPWLWAVPALLILAVTVILGIIRYPAMPATLALHYNVHGVPDRISAKSVPSAFSVVFVQACITALILLLSLLSLHSKPGIDASAPGATALKHRTFVARMTRTLLVLGACVNLSMLAVAWQVWTNTPSIALAVLPIVAGLVVLLAVAIRTGQGGSRVRVDSADEDTGVVERDDDRFWRGAGNLYFNRDDPAVLVPKRFGIGWTVNFGNPRAVALLAVPVAVLVAVRLLAH